MATGRLLVVDDEESVAITMGAILEMDGYEVTTATRGAAALDLLARETYDLVLTDLRLDDMDGLAIVSEVARRSPDTLTIILTGYASLESAIKALREGAYDYLIKPCDVEELKLTVARGVERRQIGQQLKERVHELERANQTISGFNAELQARVEEATAEVQRRLAELARANDEIALLYRRAQEHVTELQKLDELKSRFLSMASHELKTPLTAISGLSQLVVRHLERQLAAGLPSPDAWQAEQEVHLQRLRTLKEQTTKLARLVDELLDVSRIESGRVEFAFGPVDVRRLAVDVTARMQLTTTTHTLTARAEGDGPAVALADQDHLEQVLNNLIGNAIKYSPQGGEVEVVVYADDAVRISVRDAGVGIPEAQLDAVFGLFYRATEVGGRVSGMGLGLYISKEIVERHGGRIWAESRVGEGSTFWVELPRARVDAAPRAPSGVGAEPR